MIHKNTSYPLKVKKKKKDLKRNFIIHEKFWQSQ